MEMLRCPPGKTARLNTFAPGIVGLRDDWKLQDRVSASLSVANARWSFAAGSVEVALSILDMLFLAVAEIFGYNLLMLWTFLSPESCIMWLGGMSLSFSFCIVHFRALWFVSRSLERPPFSTVVFVKLFNLFWPIALDLNHSLFDEGLFV